MTYAFIARRCDDLPVAAEVVSELVEVRWRSPA